MAKVEWPQLKNTLLLDTIDGKKVGRPPVWMMRQAGRYLPEYQKLRDKYSFFERVQTPELACEITLQPIDRFQPDAAILFSDILTVPQALGINVELVKGTGPILNPVIDHPDKAFSLLAEHIEDKLDYVFQAMSLTRKELNGKVPLIGFAGAPWTLFCYMVEGQGSKTFADAKAFCYNEPAAAHHVLKQLTEATITYLNKQIENGAQAVQLFDTWAGLLSPEDFTVWAFPYIKKIINEVKGAPVMLFAKGCWYALERLSFRSGADVLGIDWAVTPEYAREATRDNVTLQGNLDPAILIGPGGMVEKTTQRMIDRFGTQRYIANLGHGVLPDTPVDNVQIFFDTVKSYKSA